MPKSPPESIPNGLGILPSVSPEKDWVNLLVTFQYIDNSLTKDLESIMLDVINKIDGIAKGEGVNVVYKYMDYAHWKQDVFGGYGADAIQDMQKVAMDYDPLGMFQHQVIGGFKVF